METTNAAKMVKQLKQMEQNNRRNKTNKWTTMEINNWKMKQQ